MNDFRCLVNGHFTLIRVTPDIEASVSPVVFGRRSKEQDPERVSNVFVKYEFSHLGRWSTNPNHHRSRPPSNYATQFPLCARWCVKTHFHHLFEIVLCSFPRSTTFSYPFLNQIFRSKDQIQDPNPTVSKTIKKKKENSLLSPLKDLYYDTRKKKSSSSRIAWTKRVTCSLRSAKKKGKVGETCNKWETHARVHWPIETFIIFQTAKNCPRPTIHIYKGNGKLRIVAI